MVLGITGLLCWIFVWIFLLFDIYLTHPRLDIPARIILMAAIFMNITGVILEIIRLIKKRKWLAFTRGLAIHVVPLAGFGIFACWLAFGHWM